jgi:hypothetical protein
MMMTERLEAAPKDATIIVEKRRDIMRDYRKLLNRWAVAAGRENEKLADLTLAVLSGNSYEDAIQ